MAVHAVGTASVDSCSLRLSNERLSSLLEVGITRVHCARLNAIETLQSLASADKTTARVAINRWQHLIVHVTLVGDIVATPVGDTWKFSVAARVAIVSTPVQVLDITRVL